MRTAIGSLVLLLVLLCGCATTYDPWSADSEYEDTPIVTRCSGGRVLICRGGPAGRIKSRRPLRCYCGVIR